MQDQGPSNSATDVSSKPKKLAWACQHTQKLHYGKGFCLNCYHLAYYHKRRAARLANGTEAPHEPPTSTKAVLKTNIKQETQQTMTSGRIQL